MTIAEALDVRDRSVSFREAEIFLQHVLDVERSFLHAHPETILTTEQAVSITKCLDRREANEPVAYITGEKEFYGRPFKTDARALIPRPETEGLVELTLVHAQKMKGPLCILEIGTGAGNIAVTLALELPTAEILATDISVDALEVAKENQKILAPKATLQFIEADLCDSLPIKNSAPYDLIVANLPYVPLAWRMDPAAQPDVVFQEPEIALFGGEDGLDLYRRFFQQAPALLAAHGVVIIEYGEDETGDITPLAAPVFPNHSLIVHKDYADLDRVLEITPKK